MDHSFNIPQNLNSGSDALFPFLSKMKEELFTLKDTDITSKNFYDWRTVDVTPPSQTKKDGDGYKDIKFTFYEWLWFKIVKDLRLLGVNYKSINRLRNECWVEITIEDKVKMIQQSAIREENKKVNKKSDKLHAEIEETNRLRSKEELVKAFKAQKHKDYVFEAMINNIILQQEDIKLLYRFDGLTSLLRELPLVKDPETKLNTSIINQYNKDFAPYPHISLSLSLYINKFFSESDNFKYLSMLNFVNEDEQEILELLRRGDLKELTIKMDQKKGKIKGYEYKKDGDYSTQDILALTRTFFLKEYENVTFKWKNNKTVYFERTSKKLFE